MFRTTPYLKAPKPEIAAFFREHIEPEKRAEYIRGVFNEEPTELLIGEQDERYGYEAHPNALHLWAGAFATRTAESFVPWRGVAREFADLIALGKFLGEPEGQLSLLPAEAPDKTIPQSAIDEILRRGSGVQEGKYRIARFFEQSQSPKERADFLKKEYSTGGVYPVLSNVFEDHDGKGITLTRGRLTKPDAQNARNGAPGILLRAARTEAESGGTIGAGHTGKPIPIGGQPNRADCVGG